MKHASLFTGIGGFDLAAQWMVWDNIFQVENDPFCQKVLTKNFPQVKRYGDIKEFDGTKYRGSIDVLSGGFPCQPYSVAGQRKGTEDARHLWPEMLRVIREVQPRFIVGENVYGLFSWSDGLVFEQVQTDLENEGYEVQAVILPACGVNAPHKRDRIWFVAHSINIGHKRQDGGLSRPERRLVSEQLSKGRGVSRCSKTLTNTNRSKRCERRVYKNGSITPERYTSTLNTRNSWRGWQDFPTQSPICRRDDGVSCELDIIRRIENEKTDSTEGLSEIERLKWTALRAMWQYRDFAAPSPRVYTHRVCNSVSIMPYERTQEQWHLGKGYEETKELRCLWSTFYSKSFEKAQELQQKLLSHLGEIERRKKMEQKQRVNRIKSLGNAIVPQVALQIFKSIEMLYE